MSTKLVKNSQKKQQESTAAEVLQNLLEYLTVIFGIIMAGVLVFYMQEGYVKIGTAKFNVYAHVCVFGMPLLLLLAIFWLLTEKQEKQKTPSGKILQTKLEYQDACPIVDKNWFL